jgi:hypothetical protein
MLAPAKLWASTDTPLPATTAFAYSVSHTAKPLPESVIEQVSSPEVGISNDDEGDAFDQDEKPVEVPVGPPRQLSRSGLCSAVASVARANNLPIPFFANLIWQESNFNPKTISRAGALGIAQFMPKTANEFGLINPFEPIHALNVAGKFVRELYGQFGNWGLAAAAYNAGPRRVIAWMAKRGDLPGETRAYVSKITGRSADQWALSSIASDPEATLMPAKAPCVEVAEAVKAQTKTVRLAKLMMELANAANEARNRAGEMTQADAADAVVDKGWRARAIRMVRDVLRGLDRKERHGASRNTVANSALRSTIKIAARELNRDGDEAGSDKGSRKTRLADRRPGKSRPAESRLADLKRRNTKPPQAAHNGPEPDEHKVANKRADAIAPDHQSETKDQSKEGTAQAAGWHKEPTPEGKEQTKIAAAKHARVRHRRVVSIEQFASIRDNPF